MGGDEYGFSQLSYGKNFKFQAAILQHTVELIQTLRAEKMKLIEEKEAVISAKKRKIQGFDNLIL